ncbi:hypothetical protein [Paenibacillus crassostreae]|uniref:Uncharacterized protein n=1 Tax=Paenibacillus crassostreae TaxID=1763538 RepID=A0A167FEG8_9BACL|nr:hypothetical protein [Paenibacillus crassostreae]AOZ90767.1 hypothetical protein LPB68_00140 [Paenibacillus crassostreae]AOZ94491.1 hypothetical protein LPB68_21345 [Paenibacillus crassostreae]OAB76468.1 hypothetical protein PNBC_03395 [Paenibacillus crassostreae]
MDKLEMNKQFLRFRGIDAGLIDTLDDGLVKLMIDMEIVDRFPVDKGISPSFNPNPYALEGGLTPGVRL